MRHAARLELRKRNRTKNTKKDKILPREEIWKIERSKRNGGKMGGGRERGREGRGVARPTTVNGCRSRGGYLYIFIQRAAIGRREGTFGLGYNPHACLLLSVTFGSPWTNLKADNAYKTPTSTKAHTKRRNTNDAQQERSALVFQMYQTVKLLIISSWRAFTDLAGKKCLLSIFLGTQSIVD